MEEKSDSSDIFKSISVSFPICHHWIFAQVDDCFFELLPAGISFWEIYRQVSEYLKYLFKWI